MSEIEAAAQPSAWDCQIEGESTQNQFFEEFCRDRETLERLEVTAEELKAISRASLLGSLTCKQDVVFILHQIRAAVRSEEEIEPSIPNARESTEAIRQAAWAKITELEALRAAKRARSLWYRIKTKLGRRGGADPCIQY